MTLILADTSVWVDHFRTSNALLEAWLTQKRVRLHPSVIGELAMGNLPHRAMTLEELSEIHAIAPAKDGEVMHLVESDQLYGAGLSWVDAHLLAATLIHGGIALWTRDKRLQAVAQRYGCAAQLHH